jgi:hypothetical protein
MIIIITYWIMGSDEATKPRKAVLARTISNILGWTRIY